MPEKPFISNGTTKDPREQVMWDLYVEGLARGYDNAYEAAIKANYEESSAKNITLRGWFKERKDKLRRKEMLSDSEKLLHKSVKYEHLDKDGNVKVDLLRVQTQVAMALAKTLGKDEGYSERSEHTGKNGEPIMFLPTEVINKLNNNETTFKTGTSHRVK